MGRLVYSYFVVPLPTRRKSAVMWLCNSICRLIKGKDIQDFKKQNYMKLIKQIAIVIAIFLTTTAFSQAPFEITLEPINITDLGGLQGFSFGQDDGKWLIIGGRLDGLHRRQPFAAFDLAGHNNQIIVVDPVSQQKWSAPITSLPTAIQEQLRSTNMEFYQVGDYLYFFGGYGYSATEEDHITYDKLTVIKVSDVIEAVINNTSFTSFFRQITDAEFQVAGGRIRQIDGTFYLLGGNKFIGRYNPQGPNFGPGFIQEYTNQVRIFTIIDDGTDLIINHLPSYTDVNNLHRRDYNAEPQILPDGTEGITMFSGVFQETIDLPFLNSVTIDVDGYSVNNSFQQYYNHYHCAVLPIFSASENEMHNVFFGGIAQYYDNEGTLVQDNNVPFVKTIARVTRDANGIMTEHKLPIEMPVLLGAGAEFIPNKNMAHYNNEVIKLDEITAEATLVGYIYGGISSTAPNIFFTNTGSQSSANSQIFKVLLTKNTLSIDDFNEHSANSLQLLIYPNPSSEKLTIKYNLIKSSDIKIAIRDVKGNVVLEEMMKNQSPGEHIITKDMVAFVNAGIYFLTIESDYGIMTRKIITENK